MKMPYLDKKRALRTFYKLKEIVICIITTDLLSGCIKHYKIQSGKEPYLFTMKHAQRLDISHRLAEKFINING